MSILDPRVFRTYDIRGYCRNMTDFDSFYEAGDHALLHTAGVQRIGQALADEFIGERLVVVGGDSRISTRSYKRALMRGLVTRGVDVIDLGLVTTDMVYYASGKWNLPAVMVTASHCPKELNGLKIVRAGAHIVGEGSGMEALRDRALALKDEEYCSTGQVRSQSILNDYLRHLLQFIDVSCIHPFTVVADAGNGVGSIVAEPLFAKMPQVKLLPMFFKPDGNFPNHLPNPFEPKNIAELMARVPAEHADFGVAWDGDADRVLFVDEQGRYINADFITALMARYFLERAPGAAIIYDSRSSWAVSEQVLRCGGRPVMERVGHSWMKLAMRREDAVFGGEASGHYFFKDHYYADNGFIPLLAIMTMLSQSGGTMSELVASLGDYYVSGEINSRTRDKQAVMDRLAAHFSDDTADFTDGLSINYSDWHFNIRPSVNDPYIRLNVEARNCSTMEARRDELVTLIQQ